MKVDGVSWQAYGENLNENLANLVKRMKKMPSKSSNRSSRCETQAKINSNAATVQFVGKRLLVRSWYLDDKSAYANGQSVSIQRRS